MSKSKGNVIAPQRIVNNLGADIIRLWVASSDYTAEMNVSDDILKQTADSYRRIRNTARYLLSNLSDFNPALNIVATENLLAIDKWAVDRAYDCQQDIIAAYSSYQFHTIYQKVHNFCSNEMGSLYLDITKDRQYTMGENSIGRRSSQTAMYHILEALTRWVAPILSFTADELWEYLPGERNESVMLNTWYDQLIPLPETEKLDLVSWEQIFKVREIVSKAIEEKRNAGLVKGGLTTEVIIKAGEQWYKPLQLVGEELKFILITSKVELIIDDISNSAIEVQVVASAQKRCDRCWHQVNEVGRNAVHPELCDRCIDNIDGDGEERHYA